MGSQWQRADSGIGSTLYDVVRTSLGPVAVGSGGVVLLRRVTGWEPVLEHGPTVQNNPLRAAAVTDDGRTVWFVGGSGVVARYDTLTRRVTDHSAPHDKTSTWTAVAVTGETGAETVYAANGSGEVKRGRMADGEMTWRAAVKPGTGSNVPGLGFRDPDHGRVVDTNGDAYATADGGESWSPFGIDAATVSLYDVAFVAADDTTVVGANGYVYEYDGGGWTEHKPSGSSLAAVSRVGQSGLAAGASGRVFERAGGEWRELPTPTGNTLLGVALDPSGAYPDVAVGASGTVVERGSYDALPTTLSVASDEPLRYRIDVDGVVEAVGATPAAVSDGEVVGELDGEAHRFRLSGDVTDFRVTEGRPAAVTIRVDGTPVPYRKLAALPWHGAPSPVGNTLHAVVPTREGPYAVGSGGDLLARRHDGWELVLDRGPAAEKNPLRGAAVTDDGRHVWFAGGSGVIGQYDVVEEQLTDYSAPGGMTSTWEDIAATGPAGAETVALVNGSGETLRGEKRDDGGMSWGFVGKPGGGSSMKGVTVGDREGQGPSGSRAEPGDDGRIYAVDTNAKVYASENAVTWEVVGIDGGSVGLYAVDAGGGAVHVAGGDGSVFRYDGHVWTKTWAGGSALFGLDREGSRGVAVGGSGNLFDLRRSGWEQQGTPTSATLYDAALTAGGTGLPDAAVGAGGAILERGGYTALPHRVELTATADRVEYELDLSGPVARVSPAGERTDGPATVSGSVEEGQTETYAFAGEPTDLRVTAGDRSALDVTYDGVPVSVERLQTQHWRAVESPVDVLLSDTARSVAGPVAVGAGGRLLVRRVEGWSVDVVNGPRDEGNALRAADATDDGERVWVAGASSVVGCYFAAEGTMVEYTTPYGRRGAWEDVAVAGPAGEETIVLVNGSGEAVRGVADDMQVTWDEPVKPAGGSSVKGVSLASPDLAHLVDTNSKVVRSTDGGRSWDEIGVEGGSIGFYDVAAVGADDVSVAGGDGSVYRYNGAVWTKNWAGGAALLGVDRLADRGVAVGAGGAIFRRGLGGWALDDAAVEETLLAVSLGVGAPDVAVGANGTIVERDR